MSRALTYLAICSRNAFDKLCCLWIEVRKGFSENFFLWKLGNSLAIKLIQMQIIMLFLCKLKTTDF